MIVISDAKGNKGLLFSQQSAAWANGQSGYTEVVKAAPVTKEDLSQLLSIVPLVSGQTPTSGSGSDPEVFFTKGNGEPLPAWEFLKAKPSEAVPTRLPHVANIFWDGVQAELAFGSGFNCHQQLVSGVRDALGKMLQLARTKDPSAKLDPQDVIKIPDAVLLGAADEHVALGCAPSVNPYGIPPIDVPDYRQHPLRYSGTHLHYSAPGAPPPWFPFGTAIMMDKIAGIVLTAAGRGWEDPRRRIAYGRPGEHRVPKAATGTFRLEYRTPGSFLLRAPELLNLGLDIGRHAFKVGLCFDGAEFPLPPAEHIIMACDADAACKYMNDHKSFFLRAFQQVWPEHSNSVWQLVMSGAAASGLFGTPEAAWQLHRSDSFFINLKDRLKFS